MSQQNDKPQQGALAADPVFQAGGVNQQAATGAQPGPSQGSSEAPHISPPQGYQGHQGHHQYRSRTKDFHVRRNSHSKSAASAGPGQPPNGYKPRGGAQGGHRYNTHSRGSSYHQNALPSQGAFQGHQSPGSIPMYPGTTAGTMPPYYAYPSVYPGAPGASGSPSSQAPPLFYPQFQFPSGAQLSRKVTLSDASGNPVDLRATVARHHHHPEEGPALGTPSPAHSRSPSSAAPETADSEATVKKAASGGSAVDAMKAMIAARKKAKADAEAAKKGTPAPEEPVSVKETVKEVPTAADRQVETTVEAETPKESTAEPAAAEQRSKAPAPVPQAEPKELSKPAPSSVSVKSDESPKSSAWKSPTAAKLEAEKAKVEEEPSETSPSEAPTEHEQKEEVKEEPSAAPKSTAWKPPSLVRLEAEKKKAESAAVAADGQENSSQAGTGSSAAEQADSEVVAPTKDEEVHEEAPKEDAAAAALAATAPTEAPAEEPKSESTETGSDAKPDAKESKEAKESEDAEATAAREAAFKSRLAVASRPTPAELENLKYPASVLPNTSLGSGQRYNYSLDFLQQFEPAVPRIHYSEVRSIVGFDFSSSPTSGGNRWGSGMGPRAMSSRGPSRVGSFANFGRGLSRNASAGSVRGRQGSRRRGDRQGSRRDRDDLTASGTPIADLPPLKKAENAWQPRFMQQKQDPDVTDDGRLSPEEVQRKVKSLLNKMAWENFERISTEIREVALQSEKETTAITLRQIIQLTFEKAIDEPHWSGMYAQLFLFLHIDNPLPDTIEDQSDPNKVIKGVYVLRRYLLNMSQREFEKGWSSITETSSGAAVLSDEYYEAIGKKRRGLGLIQFVGELYKLGLISDRLLTSCFRRLMGEEPTEDIVESTSRLLKTVAPMIMQKNGKQLLDMVMETMKKWRESGNLAARLRFMIMDVEDLARKNWEGVGQDGPKTIAAVHEEAEKREQAEQRERARRAPPGRKGDFGRPFAGSGKRR